MASGTRRADVRKRAVRRDRPRTRTAVGGTDLRIRSFAVNNRRRAFEFVIGGNRHAFPFAKASPAPTPDDPVVSAVIDPEVANNGVIYTLASGEEGFIYSPQVLEYNRDPDLLREYMLYNLTIQAQGATAKSPLSKREIMRRLRTSASQLYRLLDQANYTKSIDQMVALLQVLDCDVQISVTRPKRNA
jgi:hypothetical protein